MPLSLDFAFEGFRIIREKPKLIVFWGLVLLIGGTLADVLFVAIGGPAFERMQTLIGNPTPDPNVVLPMLPSILGAFGAAGPVLLIMSAVLSCAVFRATWSSQGGSSQGGSSQGGNSQGGNSQVGGGDRFGYLRVGADEVRQFAVMLLFYVLALALLFVDTLVASLVATVAGAAAPAVGMALSVAGLVVIFLILVRLSLCGVQSFDRKAIDLFGSWKLTAKHGWTLLGGYVVTAVMVAFVNTLCFGIFGAVVMAVNGAQWTVVDHMMHADMTSVEAYFTPVMIAREVVANLLVAPLLIALMTGAPAAAYRTLAGQMPDPGV